MNYKIMRTAVFLLVFFALLAQAFAANEELANELRNLGVSGKDIERIKKYTIPESDYLFLIELQKKINQAKQQSAIDPEYAPQKKYYNDITALQASLWEQPHSAKPTIKFVRGNEQVALIHWSKKAQDYYTSPRYFDTGNIRGRSINSLGVIIREKDRTRMSEPYLSRLVNLAKEAGMPDTDLYFHTASEQKKMIVLNFDRATVGSEMAVREMQRVFEHEYSHALFGTDFEYQKKHVSELYDKILFFETPEKTRKARELFFKKIRDFVDSDEATVFNTKNPVEIDGFLSFNDTAENDETNKYVDEAIAHIAYEKGVPRFVRISPNDSAEEKRLLTEIFNRINASVREGNFNPLGKPEKKAVSVPNNFPKPAEATQLPSSSQSIFAKPREQPEQPQKNGSAFSAQEIPTNLAKNAKGSGSIGQTPMDVEVLVNEFGEEAFSYTPAKNPNNPKTTKNFRSAAEQIKQLEQDISSLKSSGQGKAAETITRSLEQEKARLEAKLREFQKQQGKALLEKPPQKIPETEWVSPQLAELFEREKELVEEIKNPSLSPLQKHKIRTEGQLLGRLIEKQMHDEQHESFWKDTKKFWENMKESAKNLGNKEGIENAEKEIKKAEAEIEKGSIDSSNNKVIDELRSEFDFLDNLDKQGKLSNLSQQKEQELIQKIKQDFHGQKIEETKPEEKPLQKEPATKEEIQERIAELEKEIAATGNAAKIAELEGLQKKLNELAGQQPIEPTPPDQLPLVDQQPDQAQQASFLPEEPMQKCSRSLGVQPGRGEYEELGFDKLSFDWSWKTNRGEVCNARLKEVDEEKGVGVYDETKQGIIKYFCDGAQLSASVLHMAELVKEVTDKSIKASKSVLERAEELKGKTLQWENSVDSWRFAKKQAIVEERQNLDRKPKNHLFFVKDDDIVIDTKKSQELQSKSGELSLNIGTINPDNTEKLQQALERITESEFGKSIAGTWDASEEKQSQSFRDEISQKSIPEIYGAENLARKSNSENKSNYSAQKETRVLTQAELTNFMQKLFVPFQEDKGERKKRFTDAGIENMRKTARAFAETKKSCSGTIDEQVLKAAGIGEETEDGKKLKGMNVAFCHSNSGNDPNQADICWICNADGKGRAEGTGLVEVKIKFLQDFANAVLKQTAKNASSQKIKGTPTPLSYGFKIGLRHAPETEFKRELFRASDIEELASQTFKVTGGTKEEEPFPMLYRQRDEMFNEYYFRFVDFKANTITDSLNQEFRRDFTEKYKEKSELAKRFSEWRTPVLGTGTYPMKLLYKHSLVSWELKIAEDEHRKIKTLAENAEMGSYKHNVFFYLPWDGDVAQSLRFRNGYGVGFVEMPATQYYGVSHLNSSGTALQQDAGAFFYETQGFTKVDFFKASTPENQSFDTRVQATKLGKILLIDIGGQALQESAFSFSPSVPFTWQLETGAGEKLGLVYDFTEPRMPNTGIIRWNDKATRKDVIEKNISVQEAELCGMQNPPSTLQGMLYYASQIPAKRFIGYTFMPLNLVPEIVAYCGASGRVTLNGQPVPVKTGAEQSGPVQATARGNGAMGVGGEGGLKHIRDFVELMKADLVCIEGTPTATKIELRWNTEHSEIAGNIGAAGNEIARNP